MEKFPFLVRFSFEEAHLPFDYNPPFSRSWLYWPIQLAPMANTACCIDQRSQLCKMGQF